MIRHEADVVVIGGGISAAMIAQKLAEQRPAWSVIVVEAGKRFLELGSRGAWRQRNLDYLENWWPGDAIEDQAAEGIVSRTMAVGGSAMHWGGICNRFSEEDTRLRSLYGLATDWPIEWPELERYYCEAERRLGVSGEPGPYPEDRRSEPYPMPPMTMSWNLAQLKGWAEQSGTAFWTTPQAKNTVEGYDGRSKCHRCNTCEICPTGARYSPDFTFRRLLEGDRFQLHDRTLVRRLVMADDGTRIVAAEAVREDAPGEAIEYRAPRFVLAAGYCWTPALLLASANARFPNGLANRSDHVGRYMTGHLGYQAWIDLDLELYPGMNEQHSLVSRRYLRCASDTPYVRHDLRVWESAEEREPRLRDTKGKVLLGDALLAEWRSRARRGTARVRGYYDTHPDRESRVVLDPARRNRWGDPLPAVRHKLDAAAEARAESTRAHFEGLFAELARANDGKVLRMAPTGYQDHPCGGCRMGEDPAESVVDPHGRTHDHENLWVVGAPTLPTGGCTNGTLTFVALTLRSADAIAKAG